MCARDEIFAIFGAANQSFFTMAKGNVFLGMGRGSIGDVTFYRADGEQLSRVRNRRPRNPKTPAQLYQRAIMATVVKAYQAGKAIFDHSFQGYSVGAQCQQQFLKLNAKMLRGLVATDINTPIATNDQKARVIAPGVNTPVANPFIISRGSYQQNLWGTVPGELGYQLPELESNETVAQYAQRVGLIAGDIYTFVAFAELEDMAYVSPHSDDSLASLNYCDFGWVRCIVKSGLSDVSDVAATLGQLFTFQSSGGYYDVEKSRIGSVGIGNMVGFGQLWNQEGDVPLGSGALGLIRSRLDQDLRSDSVMQVYYGSSATDKYGIASDYILQTWESGTTSVGDSTLILEGGNG